MKSPSKKSHASRPLARHASTAWLAALLTSLVLLTSAMPATGQSARTLSEDAQVSLLTILPGDAIYSAYGHSALRVHDPVQNIDLVFNYGTFDFSPFFAFEFAYGQLDYMLSVATMRSALLSYRRQERPVIEQVLDLTPAQKNGIFHFLQINARPENRVYRYDFFFDNCSTRIRDVIVDVLGDSVHFNHAPGASLTFRQLVDPYHGPFLDAGIDVLLGAPTDRPATPWETMFLPDHLMGAFEQARIAHGDDTSPLVARTDTLFWVEGYTHIPEHLPWPSIILWTLFAGWAGVTLWQYRTERTPPRLPDVLLFGTVGGIGLVITILWFVSLHQVTEPNWNLIWAWPTHAVAAAMIGRSTRPLRRYWQATAATSLLVALTWWLWPQALPAAALPLVLLLALRAGWYGLVGSLPAITRHRTAAHPQAGSE